MGTIDVIGQVVRGLREDTERSDQVKEKTVADWEILTLADAFKPHLPEAPGQRAQDEIDKWARRRAEGFSAEELEGTWYYPTQEVADRDIAYWCRRGKLAVPDPSLDASVKRDMEGAKKVEVSREKLEKVAADVVELVLKKNSDYGDAWQRQGVVGILVRISDKVLRLETLADGRQGLVVDEKWCDTLRDVVGYALLGLLLGEKKSHYIRRDDEEGR